MALDDIVISHGFLSESGEPIVVWRYRGQEVLLTPTEADASAGFLLLAASRARADHALATTELAAIFGGRA